jgi:hypothetical protein
MNFFEQELRKVAGLCTPLYDVRFSGRVCLGRLSGTVSAKLQFVTTGISGHYNAINATVINRNDGVIDSSTLFFKDILGKKSVANPYFQDGINPYIWDDRENVDWYIYHPSQADYKSIADALNNYLSVFQEADLDRRQNETQQKLSTLGEIRADRKKPSKTKSDPPSSKKPHEQAL